MCRTLLISPLPGLFPWIPPSHLSPPWTPFLSSSDACSCSLAAWGPLAVPVGQGRRGQRVGSAWQPRAVGAGTQVELAL